MEIRTESMFDEESQVMRYTSPAVITSPPLGEVTRNHIEGVAVGVSVKIGGTDVNVGVSDGVGVYVGVNVGGTVIVFVGVEVTVVVLVGVEVSVRVGV